MIVRHKLLVKLVNLWKENKLTNGIDRLPIGLSPRCSRPFGRCCIHRGRAVYKYELFPLLGFDMTDETDELIPLPEYAHHALERKNEQKENILCAVDEACSSCAQVNHEITNLCRGCMARSCCMNCPKDVIRFRKNGQAKIDHGACISCGKCHQSCPHHAIVFIPVPYEETCPVKAINKDENGIEHIDGSKRIYCSKCLNACPFGAIFKISQAFDVLEGIRRGEKMVAIPVPSILGQFNTSTEAVYGVLCQMGFADAVEVARGAMDTVSHEAAGLKKKLEEGQPPMTTSYYPSYTELVNKHIPRMEPYASSTRSPMYYAAHIAKERHPDVKIVFIDSCVARRKETRRDECVDYIPTLEKVASIFEGLDVQLEQTQSFSAPYTSMREAHGLAQTGGVMEAIQAYLGEEVRRFSAIQVSDLNKKNIGLPRAVAKTDEVRGQFIEVMACEGGCISGPSAYNDAVGGHRQLNQELIKRRELYEETHR